MSKQAIFVVDDEPLITRLAQINLERAGYSVQMAHNGIEALEGLAGMEVKPNLILMDVMMPYMDGFELLQKLQEDATLRDIPVIIMTARSRDEDILLGEELGAKRYLTKPINPTELVKLVAEVIQQSNKDAAKEESKAESKEETKIMATETTAAPEPALDPVSEMD